MAPVQKLGNVDTKKRTSQKVAFGLFTLLSYLVVVILFLILGFIDVSKRQAVNMRRHCIPYATRFQLGHTHLQLACMQCSFIMPSVKEWIWES